MPAIPKFGDSENNLIAKIAINTGPNLPTVGDGRWNLLYKVCQNTYSSASGEGGYIDGEVQAYGDLPIVINYPPLNSVYLVLEATGIPFINRKQAGLYVRKSQNGTLEDWVYAGEDVAVIGATGATGPVGNDGATGPIGATGLTGATGPVNSNSWQLISISDSALFTGTTTNSLISSFLIPANTLKTNSIIEFSTKFEKNGTAGTATERIYINSINSLVGASQIAVFSPLATNAYSKIYRTFSYDGSFLKGFRNTQSNTTDANALNGGRTLTSVNRSIDNYIMVSGQLADATDSLINYETFIEICSQ